tara:strand:+ start:1891 stop:2691 length:801 start_codon:yes stop_codon:yes gene_type:complete
MKKLYTILLSSFILASCSVSNDVITNRKVQKRKYTKGFTVKKTNSPVFQNLLTKNFKTSINKSESLEKSNIFLASLEIKPINISHKKPELKKITCNIQEILCSKEDAEKAILKNNYKLKNVLAARKKYKNLKKYFENNQKNTDGDCDNLVYKNGNEVSAKVVEITTDVVKYKRCNNLNGPLISVKKSELLLIRYSNGEKELFTNYKEESSESSEDGNKKAKTYNTISIIFSSLSIIFTLFISIILGLIFLIPALIFLGLGAAAKKK